MYGKARKNKKETKGTFRFPRHYMIIKDKSIYFLLCFVFICPVVVLFFLAKQPLRAQLKVLTYSSFTGVYGPGRIIKARFESFCDCELQWFLAEDSTALLQRFALIPEMDVVIGWDQITLQSAQGKAWEDLSFLKNSFVKAKTAQGFNSEFFFKNPYFLPLDWSPIGFLHKGKNSNIKSLKSLYEIKGKISFPEPRTSTLGLQFYYWIYEVFEGDQKQMSDFFAQLKNKIYGPVFSWSMAYGFFQKGQTDMSLSYLSSLLYHQKESAGESYFFSYFEEGQPYQVEYLSVSKASKNKKQALEFAKFLLSKEIQKEIRDRHYMLPVSTHFPEDNILPLTGIKLISYRKLDEFIKKKKLLLKFWEENLY